MWTDLGDDGEFGPEVTDLGDDGEFGLTWGMMVSLD